MRKPNKNGCIVVDDVCMAHEQPLVCRHGCKLATWHKCKDQEEAEEEQELKEKNQDYIDSVML